MRTTKKTSLHFWTLWLIPLGFMILSLAASPSRAGAQDISEGEQLFTAKGCNACHSIGGGDLVGPDLAAGSLVELMPSYRGLELGIYAVYPTRKHVSPKVRLLIDFLVEAFKQPRWRDDRPSTPAAAATGGARRTRPSSGPGPPPRGSPSGPPPLHASTRNGTPSAPPI